ncbi:MAG: SH3 domain-containing protein, partial [Candidatus Gottesmanbacteria bacterium]|nr:SH3 domain-containing protein [Candidatus Gottesmanbacteria bacterium]
HHNDNPDWANVGMLGQVDVKVTSENGIIQPGDRLTSSSRVGVAMKATRAGQVVGRALGSWTDSDSSHIGMIQLLVSPTYFDPAESDDNQADLAQLRIEAANITPYAEQIPFAKAGNATATTNFGKYSIQGVVSGTIKALGEFTSIVVANLKAGILQSNEVSTDTLSANQAAFGNIVGNQAIVDSLTAGTITPDASGVINVKLGVDGKVAILDSNQNEVFSVDAAGNGYFAGTITADKIRVSQIEGLDLTSLLYSASSSGNILTQPVVSDGLALTGDLTASGSSTFNGPALFSELVTFIKDLIVQGQVAINGSLKVLGDVIFGGHLTVNTDTAGIAVIPSSAMSVDVPFEKPFTEPPIVTITLVLPEATDSAFLAEGAKAAVTNVTTNGFTIVLADPVPRDLMYNWFVLAVTGGRRIVGKTIDGSGSTSTLLMGTTSSILGDTIVTPSATLTPTLTPTPTATPSPTLTPTATPVPTATPAPTPTPSSSTNTLTLLSNDLGFVRTQDAPSIYATEIGQIPTGVTVPYDDVQYGWYHVTYNQIVGWISSTYVQVN